MIKKPDIFDPTMGWRARFDAGGNLAFELQDLNGESFTAWVTVGLRSNERDNSSAILARRQATHTLMSAMAQFLNSGGSAYEIMDIAGVLQQAREENSGQELALDERFVLIHSDQPPSVRRHIFLNQDNERLILFEEDTCAEEYTLEEFHNRMLEDDTETPEV